MSTSFEASSGRESAESSGYLFSYMEFAAIALVRYSSANSSLSSSTWQSMTPRSSAFCFLYSSPWSSCPTLPSTQMTSRPFSSCSHLMQTEVSKPPEYASTTFSLLMMGASFLGMWNTMRTSPMRCYLSHLRYASTKRRAAVCTCFWKGASTAMSAGARHERHHPEETTTTLSGLWGCAEAARTETTDYRRREIARWRRFCASAAVWPSRMAEAAMPSYVAVSVCTV